MKTWADFAPYVNADVPGVATFHAERKIRLAAIEFCERTKVWREILDPILIVPGFCDYDIDTDPGTNLVKVMSAKLDGHDENLLSFEDSRPFGVELTSNTTFRINPNPASKAWLRLTVVLQPSQDAKGISDQLFEQYVEAISHGAKARLYKEPEKPYTDIGRANDELALFEQAVAKVKVDAAKGFSGAPIRTKPQFF